MNDFLILDSDKNRLKEVFPLIEKKVNNDLLFTNNKSGIYNMKNGVNFLGYY